METPLSVLSLSLDDSDEEVPAPALPMEIIDLVVRQYMEDFEDSKHGDPWVVQRLHGRLKIVPLLQTSRSIRDLILPLLYTTLRFPTPQSYFSFLQVPSLPSQHLIRNVKISFHHNPQVWHTESELVPVFKSRLEESQRRRSIVEVGLFGERMGGKEPVPMQRPAGKLMLERLVVARAARMSQAMCSIFATRSLQLWGSFTPSSRLPFLQLSPHLTHLSIRDPLHLNYLTSLLLSPPTPQSISLFTLSLLEVHIPQDQRGGMRQWVEPLKVLGRNRKSFREVRAVLEDVDEGRGSLGDGGNGSQEVMVVAKDYPQMSLMVSGKGGTSKGTRDVEVLAELFPFRNRSRSRVRQ